MTATHFIESLSQLCESGETGTLFLVTQENRQVRIGIARGRINHIGMFPLRGAAAVGALAATRITGVRFQAQVMQEDQPDLPETSTVLVMLSAGAGVASASGERVPTTPTAPAASVPLSREALRIVEAELAEYLGPIAGILVDEQAAKCANREALIKALLPNFDNPDHAAAFTKKVRHRVK